MNEIKLRGYIKDIQYSHTINGVDYNKANLIVPNRHTHDDDIISLCFKSNTNRYNVGDLIELSGNIRSYSRKLNDSKNKVDIYVFTYFDLPETNDDKEVINEVEIDGRICKMDELRSHTSGPQSLSFILANNIILSDGKGKINTYLPVVCWGKDATAISSYPIGTFLTIKGSLQSRIYRKQIDDSIELRLAHELVLSDYEIL